MQDTYTAPLTLGVSHCGADGALAPDRALEFFQDLAAAHGERLGVGLGAMSKKGKFWLTVRTRLRVFEAPKLGQTVVGATWPAAPEKLRCHRYYTICDQAGNLLADGRTEWTVLDLQTGRPTTAEGLFPEGLVFRTDTAAGGDFVRLPSDPAALSELRAYTVPSTDIDVGQHMNNIAYIRALLGSFSVKERREHPIRTLEVCYRTPCFEGERLSVRGADGSYIICKQDGTPALLAQLEV